MITTTHTLFNQPSLHHHTLEGTNCCPRNQRGGRYQLGKISTISWRPNKNLVACQSCYQLGSFAIDRPTTVESGRFTRWRRRTLHDFIFGGFFDFGSGCWRMGCLPIDAAGYDKLNPFLLHGFLSSLEETGCAVEETGWLPQHIIAKDQQEHILGVVPLYLKSHSYDEYVFDFSWADAFYNFGAEYYPKLQCCVPFTPVTGQRILIRRTWCRDQIFQKLVRVLKDMAHKLQVSSLHVTFPSEGEWQEMEKDGFLQRIGMQYHWRNQNYKNFDEFLMDLKQSKRKNIRQERKKVSVQNLKMKRLRGDEIKGKYWDSFYKFYRNTTDNKWGRAFLTREFFHTMGSKLGDRVLLVVAEEDDELVAGSLNLVGGDTLFGRLWGCQPEAYYPSLHFEACYYQAIEAAIEMNLAKVEAGAQGEHKIQRGYLPVTTYSCHYILDEAFRKAIQEFLVLETQQVKQVIRILNDSGPFKEGLFLGDL